MAYNFFDIAASTTRIERKSDEYVREIIERRRDVSIEAEDRRLADLMRTKLITPIGSPLSYSITTTPLPEPMKWGEALIKQSLALVKQGGVPDSRISEIAHSAADGLIKHGHVKGFLYNAKGSMCALGAIDYAAGDGYFTWSEQTAKERLVLTGALRLTETIICHQYHGSIPAWNNDPVRTADEVITALRRVGNEWAYKTYSDNIGRELPVAATQAEVELAGGESV